MKGSGLTEDREKARRDGQRREACDLNSKQGNQRREERREEESSGVHDLESTSGGVTQGLFFLITGAQCVNSIPAPYLCHGTHTYSNPMTNAADNSITEDFNRGYLGDSQQAKAA